VVADTDYPQYGDIFTDVLHYGLDLKWDPSGMVLTGTATLAVRAAAPTNRFVLDLGVSMQVDAVTVDGRGVRAAHDGDHLTVPLGRPVAQDDVSTVVIAYHGTPETVKAPVTRRDIQGVGAAVTATGGVWAQQEPYGAFTWYPCNDQPSDKALYDVSITAPDGWAGVTGGAFLGRTEVGGQGVYRWRQPDPVSTYLVAFSVDQFKEETATGPHGLPITYWYLPQNADAVHTLTAQVPGMISFLEQHFGPYPFPTAGVLFRPEHVGMETQTMITLGAGTPAEDLLHEFAHQWFGDTVTPKTWADLWLNEGFAMYSQFLWDDRGSGVSMDTFMQAYQAEDQLLRNTDGPPGKFIPSHFASSNVYIPPAVMLNKIRDRVGDTAFYSLLTDWSHRAKDSSQDRASFIAYADQHTGKDLSGLINAWLDSPTTPTG
jgi:aminopeptidase N